MSELKDLTDQRFGRLTIISRAESTDKGLARWNCKCDCGNLITVRGSSLRGGKTLSCGCYQRENLTKRNTKHGKRKTRLYAVWCGMKERCNNPKATNYKDYGGRGITVCEEWRDFTKFEAWATDYLSDAERGKCTIDRIDVNKGYSPDNCRWIDMKAQSMNKRNSI